MLQVVDEPTFYSESAWEKGTGLNYVFEASFPLLRFLLFCLFNQAIAENSKAKSDADDFACKIIPKIISRMVKN